LAIEAIRSAAKVKRNKLACRIYFPRWKMNKFAKPFEEHLAQCTMHMLQLIVKLVLFKKRKKRGCPLRPAQETCKQDAGHYLETVVAALIQSVVKLRNGVSEFATTYENKELFSRCNVYHVLRIAKDSILPSF